MSLLMVCYWLRPVSKGRVQEWRFRQMLSSVMASGIIRTGCHLCSPCAWPEQRRPEIILYVLNSDVAYWLIGFNNHKSIHM